MNNRTLTMMIGLTLATVLLTGCMGNDEINKEEIAEEMLYEEAISNLTLEDQVEGSAWTGTGSISIDLDGAAVGYPSAEVSRPEHFHKAWIEVEWGSTSQDIFENARAAAGSAPSFSSPWASDSGSGTLNLEVDEQHWDHGDLLVALYPGDNPDSMSAQVEIDVEFRITLMEHIPIVEAQEDTEEEENGRGSTGP